MTTSNPHCLAILAFSALVAIVPPHQAYAAGIWTATGSLHVARESHTATLLNNGKVLAAGGEGSAGVVATAEAYNPITSLWVAAGKLNVARAAHNALLLKNGKVLIAGGCIGSCLRNDTATAELYDPTTGVWSLTDAMHTVRVNFGMVLLGNGKVLAMGGCTAQNSGGCITVTATAELYDPATGTWKVTGSLHNGRSAFTATALGNGKILVAGGTNGVGTPLATAEIYDPATASWSATGHMAVARDEHTATLLQSGQVLVAGGENIAGVSETRTELYNPINKTWALSGDMHASRLEHTAVLLKNGTVLVVGGNRVTPTTTTVLSSAEIYSPASGTWTVTGKMNSVRVGHTSTLLVSGMVLSAGGANATTELNSAEIYLP